SFIVNIANLPKACDVNLLPHPPANELHGQADVSRSAKSVAPTPEGPRSRKPLRKPKATFPHIHTEGITVYGRDMTPKARKSRRGSSHSRSKMGRLRNCCPWETAVVRGFARWWPVARLSAIGSGEVRRSL